MLNKKYFTLFLVSIYIFTVALNAKEYTNTSYYVAYDNNDKTQYALVMPSVHKVYTHQAGKIEGKDLSQIDRQFPAFPTYNNGELCFSALKEDASGESGASVMAGKCYRVDFFYTQKEVVQGKGVAFILTYTPSDTVYEGLAGKATSFKVVKSGDTVSNENSITGADYATFRFDVLILKVILEKEIIDLTGFSPSLRLKENDFWIYKWQTNQTTSAQGSNPSVINKYGEFRITLGVSTLINGEEAFPVIIEGDSGKYTPRWKYLAIADDSSLLGSTGGAFQIIYSSTETQWYGGGFFISFRDSDKIKVQKSTYEGIYNTLEAMLVSHVDSSGGCEYVVGNQICSENSVTARVDEHYKKGLGTIGAYEYYHYTYSGGNFFSTHRMISSIELIGSSLSALDGSTLNEPSWKEVATLPDPLNDLYSAAILNNKIYISGRGVGYIQVYNIITNSFEKKINFNFFDTLPENHLHVLDGFLYIMNKYEGIYKLIDTEKDIVLEYKNTFNSWPISTTWNYFNEDDNTTTDFTLGIGYFSITQNERSIGIFDPYNNLYNYFNETLINYQRWTGFKIIELNNILYFLGGDYLSNSTWNTWSEREQIIRFDLLDGKWIEGSAAKRNKPIKYTSWVKYNGKLIALGGYYDNMAVATVEEYDPKVDSWKKLEAMPYPIVDLKAVAAKNKIYVITRSKILSFEP